jgi:hypothetical protein
MSGLAGMFALGPTRPMPASTGDGSIVPFLIFLGICLWVGLQFRPARRTAWERRARFIIPLFRHVAADIFAVYSMVANWANARWQGKKFRDQLGEDDSWPWK